MSKEDLEVVRRSFDSHAWDKADWDTLKELYDEDVVFHSSIVDIVGKTVVGHEALRRFMTEIQEEWTSLRWELEEIFEAPRGIVTFHRVVGIGRTTGLEVTKAVTGHLRGARWPDRQGVGLRRPRRSARSCRAVGVGH